MCGKTVLKLVFICVAAAQAPPGCGQGSTLAGNGSEALVALQPACAPLLDSVQALHCTTISNNHVLDGYTHKLDAWANKVMASQEWQPSHAVPPVAHMYSTPAKMLLSCVLLPMFAFFLFFIYVIFFTGPQTMTPYLQLDYKKNI